MRDSGHLEPLVIFDGDCGFCSSFVSFVLRHEKTKKFIFSPNQSPYGRTLLERHGLSDISRDTLIVLEGGRVLVQSDAALHIAADLKPPYSWFAYGAIIPRPIRDAAYRFVASVRSWLPGSRNACGVLSAEYQARIIESNPAGGLRTD